LPALCLPFGVSLFCVAFLGMWFVPVMQNLGGGQDDGVCRQVPPLFLYR